MQNALQTRWHADCVSRRSARGNIDIQKLIGDWFDDPDWCRDVRMIPPADRRRLLEEVGQDAIDRNIGNFAAELDWNFELLSWLWTSEERRAIASEHAQSLFSSLSDSIDFAVGNVDLGEIVCTGTEHLHQALSEGRGVILASVFQSHPGYAFVSEALREYRIGVVRKSLDYTSSISMAGLPDNVIELPASRAAVRTMFEILKEGQVVAAYCDYVYPDSIGMDSPMFGWHTTVSRSLLKIALRSGAVMVPMCIARQAGAGQTAVRVEFFPGLNAGGSDHNTLHNLSFRLGVALECLIRRYPPQWRLWNTLRDQLH